MPKSKFYMPDWLQHQPYNKPDAADYAFVKITNQILDLIYSPAAQPIANALTEEAQKALAHLLASYLEDVVSNTNIFRAFTTERHKLYNRTLPFYSCHNYDNDEINLVDVRFLIWYFFANLEEDVLMFSPHNQKILYFADQVYVILDQAYETVPENTKLYHFLHLPDRKVSFYEIRSLMGWLFCSGFLFRHNTYKINNQIDDQAEIIENKLSTQDWHEFKNEIQDTFIWNEHCSLLAYRASTWLALILGDNHPLHQALLDVSFKKRGIHEYLRKTSDKIYFKHVATEAEIEVMSGGIQFVDQLNRVGQLWTIAFVSFNNSWWNSGMSYDIPWDADRILDEKNDPYQRSLHGGTIAERLAVIQQQQNLFEQFNEGSLIHYYLSGAEAKEFITKWSEFYNNSLKLSAKEIAKSIKAFRKKGITQEQVSFGDSFPEEAGLVFFNPNVGIEVLTADLTWIPDPNNPYLKPPINERAFIELLFNPVFSKEIFEYLWNKQTHLTLSFPGKPPDPCLNENIDFFQRFNKYDSYNDEPKSYIV